MHIPDDPSEQYSMAQNFAKGIGVKKDAREAFRLLKMVVSSPNENGTPNKHASDAYFSLANFYRSGFGTERNYVSALENYRLAADLGHVDAKCNLATCYARTCSHDSVNL